MNKILNPFEYLSNGKAFGWGLAGTVFAIGLVMVTRGLAEWDWARTVWLLSTNVLLWLPLSALLYILALIFSPSRIRAVDIFASNIFALLPSIVLVGVVNAITFWLAGVSVDPLSFAGIMTRALYNLLVIILSVSCVWSMVWGCFAYYVSANMKGIRGVVIFIFCFVLVSVLTQLLNEYI